MHIFRNCSEIIQAYSESCVTSTYSEPCQTSMMERFAKIVNSYSSFLQINIIFAILLQRSLFYINSTVTQGAVGREF